MESRDRKLAVLRQLGQESEPVTATHLASSLGFDYNIRTVRRWLQDLINEGLVQKYGHTKNAKYIAVKSPSRSRDQASPLSQNEHTLNHVSSCFSSDSLIAIQEISKPIFDRTPISYDIEWFNTYQPNISFYLSEALRKQLLAAGQRATGKDPAGTYAHQIFNRLIIDLSYNSSRLEGNTYSLLDTERLIFHGDSVEGKLDEEKVMILNHKEAIRYLVENAHRLEINKNVICTLHYLLSDGLVEPKYAGKVRDHGVRIGGSTYIPFSDPERLLLQLEKIVSKAAEICDPFEQSFFLLVHISYLQAFEDVNKRTARLAANIPLITKNLVPLSFSDVERQDYSSAMIAAYELREIRPLADLYVYSYLRTCAAYDSTVKALGFDEVRVRFRQQRRAIIREIILQNLVKDDMVDYVSAESCAKIPKEYQQLFLEDVLEDLDQMDGSRLAGLGITPDQLNEWLKLYRS